MKVIISLLVLTKQASVLGEPTWQRSCKQVDSARKHTLRHIIIKLPKIKDKERILKSTKEKETVTYKGVPLRLSADFSKETLQARRGWKEVFKVMQGKDLYPRSIQQSYHLEWKDR